jgi:stearoyl-CoA desaturase (delta-9 desaturase)
MTVFILITVHWYASLFFHSLFHHRYASHRMFDMSKVWEKIFFLICFIVQGSSYLSPYAYGVMHRIHHAYADTDKDPHSPMYDRNILSMLLRTERIFTALCQGRYQAEERFTRDVPSWPWFDKWTNFRCTRIAWGLVYVGVYYWLAPEAWQLIFVPIHIAMSPIQGVIINWCAHKYGYVNFKVNNTSKNLFPVDVLMLGEGYHNNHHKFSSRANFGWRWHEIDPVYPFLRLFDKVGVIHLKNH